VVVPLAAAESLREREATRKARPSPKRREETTRGTTAAGVADADSADTARATSGAAELAAATRRERSPSLAMTAVTSWKAAKAVGAEAAVVVAVSAAVDSAADIVEPTRASGAAAVFAVAAVSAVLSGAAVVRRVGLEAGVVAAAGVEAVAGVMVERAARKFKSFSPFLWLMRVFFLSSA